MVLYLEMWSDIRIDCQGKKSSFWVLVKRKVVVINSNDIDFRIGVLLPCTIVSVVSFRNKIKII